MKSASTIDSWRRLYRQDMSRFPARLTKLTYSNSSSLGNGSIEFSGPLTAICGANGVGKTTILKAVQHLLNQAIEDTDRPQSNIDGNLSVNCSFGNNSFTVQSNADSMPEGVDKIVCRWLDIGSTVIHLVDTVFNSPNFDDVIEGLEAKNMVDVDLSEISNLVGKLYTSLKVYEIEDFGPFEPFPFFVAECDGTTYNSANMGIGEYSVLYGYWALNQVPDNSILLLEEPETRISYASQRKFIDHLAKFCNEHLVWTILCTHSPAIFGRIPVAHVRMLYKKSGNSICFQPRQSDLRKNLGLPDTYVGFVWVEDQTALDFAGTLLNYLAPSLASQIDLSVAGSDSEITAILKAIPWKSSPIVHLGLYDADVDIDSIQKQLIATEKARQGIVSPQVWPTIKLPGAASFEEELMNLARLDYDGIAEEIGKGSTGVAVASYALVLHAASDPHDWLIAMARELGMSKRDLTHRLTLIWLSVESNRKLAEGTVNDIIKSIPSIVL